MILVPLCRISVQYSKGSWHRLFGGQQGAGYGLGEGVVTGDTLNGALAWSNHATRREDGVWCPSLRGFLVTDDGAEILVSVDGISILGDSPDVRRAILARAEFSASDPRYRWLNTCFAVAEGEFAEADHGWWLQCHVAVNDAVPYAAAIGEPAPARYRQSVPSTPS